MNKDEIIDSANIAEFFEGANELNFREVPFRALVDWAELHEKEIIKTQPNTLSIYDFDVESVMDTFVSWWKKARCQ